MERLVKLPFSQPSPPLSPVGDAPVPSATQRVMDVNFFAGVRITKALLPLLMDSKGRVVNVTSTCGFWANPQVMPP